MVILFKAQSLTSARHISLLILSDGHHLHRDSEEEHSWWGRCQLPGDWYRKQRCLHPRPRSFHHPLQGKLSLTLRQADKNSKLVWMFRTDGLSLLLTMSRVNTQTLSVKDKHAAFKPDCSTQVVEIFWNKNTGTLNLSLWVQIQNDSQCLSLISSPVLSRSSSSCSYKVRFNCFSQKRKVDTICSQS